MDRRLRVGAGLLAAALALTLTVGCSPSENEDCDAEDLAHYEDECGYYTADGVWVLYPWVVPGVGGRPPTGSHPKPPTGVKTGAPKVGSQPKAPTAPRAPARRTSTRGR